MSEADDKLKKSIIQKDIETASVAQVMLEAARQKMTQVNQSLSEVHRKRDSIAAVLPQLVTPPAVVKKRQL